MVFSTKDALWQEQTLQQKYTTLQGKVITSVQGYIDFLKAWDHLRAVISEEMGWRYIRMTGNTNHTDYQKDYQFFVEKVVPQTIIQDQKIKQKLVKYYSEGCLVAQKDIVLLIKDMQQDMVIYREENVAIDTALQMLAQKYTQMVGGLVVYYQEKKYTIPQAMLALESKDRKKREGFYHAIAAAYHQISSDVEVVFDEMIQKRHTMALHAGFKNFRDYMFVAMHRNDYTPVDCMHMHEAIEKNVVPLLNDFAKKKSKKLSLHPYKPWDQQVDSDGKSPLRPLKSKEDLLAKTIQVLQRIDPYFGDCLKKMQAKQQLDLFAREGKAPGGYNYPLDITGVPFIFMNATNTWHDIITLIHEAGHAVHNFLMTDLPLHLFKHPTCEVAELASMTMELITMDEWSIFFEEEEAFKRAKKMHLQSILGTLAWVSTVDSFQHWVYENPQHTVEQRHAKWQVLFEKYTNHITDWSSLETNKRILWQRQLHIFEVPFYYIEYGIAQLGAIALWRNFQKDPKNTLEKYKKALSLGHTASIKTVYTTAGISFDFSPDYIQELIFFVKKSLALLD